nr:putative leucine-rich repeat-containing protein DDB_G0290503 [Maniola hyperantus]
MLRKVVPKFEMRCCVPLCSNDADSVSQPGDISFHMFPDSSEMRKFWLDALDLNSWSEKDPAAVASAVVCSEHFASSDLYSTKSGFRKLRVGAVPLVIQESLDDEAMAEDEHLVEQLQVCRICLETEGRLISMSDCKLDEVYQNLTGCLMSNDLRVSQTFCPECAQRLRNFEKFREKSLTADQLISNLLKTTEWSIKEEFMKIEREEHGLESNMGKVLLNYDHCDLFIKENFDNKQITSTHTSSTELNELTVINTPNVSGTGIKIEKLTPAPHKLARPAPNPLSSNFSSIPFKQNTPHVQQTALRTYPSPSLIKKAQKAPNLLQTSPKPKINVTQMPKNIATDTRMNTQNISDQTTYSNRQSGIKIVNRNETNQTKTNTPVFENQVVIKKEINPDNPEQTRIQVDYIPVIDVVIDKKFKIVRKEEMLLKNTQLIFNNNKAIVQQIEKNNKAVIRNKRGVPIGIDLNKSNLSVVTNKQPILPVIVGDRIVMPNAQDMPKNVPTPNTASTAIHHIPINTKTQAKTVPIMKHIQQPISQNKPKNRQFVQEKPKIIPTSSQSNKNVSVTKNTQKHMPIITDENPKDMPLIEDNQNNMPVIEDNHTEIDNNQTEIGNICEVPVENYEEQEFYEEPIEETVVTEDYLEMNSESDTEMQDIKKEVENIIKEETDEVSNTYTDPLDADEMKCTTDSNENENNETWDENQENNETWDGNQDNNETWDENQENTETYDENQENTETYDENQENDETWDENQENDETWDENDENREKWVPDDFSEDEDNENDQNSEAEESIEPKKIIDRFDPEVLKRTRMQRKRKSVLRNYGKAYFSDDLNDVIFSITKLSFEEQLIEIRNRLYTKFKNAAFTCGFCYRGFMNEYAYNRHIALHNSEDGHHACEVCKFKFKTAKLLSNHIAARHATKFSCNLCEFTSTAPEPARLHGMKHRGIRYQCPHCPEDYLRYTVLMDHMAIKHSPESLCPVCGLKLGSDEELERHKTARHTAQCDQDRWDTATHCERCDILFASEEAYRFHLGVSIKHDSEFIIEHQKAKRTQEEYMKPASQYKKPDILGPLTCEQCGLKVASLRKYHAHFRRDHPDKTRTFYPTMKKKVMCELCGRFFKAQWQYVEHLRLHTNERPYACEICGKAFVTNRLLCQHRSVHDLRQ